MDTEGDILLSKLGITEQKRFGSSSTTNTVYIQTKLIHIVLEGNLKKGM